MDSHRLRCFVTVFEKRSVSAAAEALHMTQPPLSILLKKLEQELGVDLFDRSANRLHPTPTGELFYLRSKELLASMATISRELKETQAGARETLRIGCSTAASLFIFPQVMKEIAALGLPVTVHAHEGETDYLIQRLRDGNLDIAICRSQYNASDLESRSLMREPLLVALPPNHPLEKKRHIKLNDLRHENFILHSSPLGSGISDSLISACQASGFMPNVIYRGVETLPMLLMVKCGLGISFAPASFAKLDLAGLPNLVPLKNPEIQTHMNLITRKEGKQSEFIRLFIEFVWKSVNKVK